MRRGSGRRLVIALTVEAATGRGACWRSVIVLTVAAAKHGHGKDRTERKHQDRSSTVVGWRLRSLTGHHVRVRLSTDRLRTEKGCSSTLRHSVAAAPQQRGDVRLTNDRRYRNTPIPHRSPRTKVPRGTNTGRLSVRSFHCQLSRSSQHAFPSCDRRPNSPEYNAVHQVVTVPYPNVTTPGSISVSAQSQEDRVRGEAHSAPFTDPLLFASSLTYYAQLRASWSDRLGPRPSGH